MSPADCWALGRVEGGERGAQLKAAAQETLRAADIAALRPDMQG